MSKEYTQALDDLFGLVAFQKSLTREQFERVQKYNDIIEQALQRLEAIDNANPSEALGCLEKIKDSFGCDLAYYGLNLEYEVVEKALLKAQEQEKVLEIERKSSMVAQEILGDYAILKKQYCKVVDELLEKERVLDGYKDLEEEIGCPLEVVFKLVNQNELYYQFYNELQHWTSVKVDLRKKVVWYCKQVGGHYACSQPLSNYGKTFWLREDKSE